MRSTTRITSAQQRALNKKLELYGSTKIMSEAIGVSEPTIRRIKSTGKGTVEKVNKILSYLGLGEEVPA